LDAANIPIRLLQFFGRLLEFSLLLFACWQLQKTEDMMPNMSLPVLSPSLAGQLGGLSVLGFYKPLTQRHPPEW
jgi:hypothetical protein